MGLSQSCPTIRIANQPNERLNIHEVPRAVGPESRQQQLRHREQGLVGEPVELGPVVQAEVQTTCGQTHKRLNCNQMRVVGPPGLEPGTNGL